MAKLVKHCLEVIFKVSKAQGEEIFKDKFEIAPICDRVIEAMGIRGQRGSSPQTSTPDSGSKVVFLSGEWGSGKTSIARAIEQKLKESKTDDSSSGIDVHYFDMVEHEILQATGSSDTKIENEAKVAYLLDELVNEIASGKRLRGLLKAKMHIAATLLLLLLIFALLSCTYATCLTAEHVSLGELGYMLLATILATGGALLENSEDILKTFALVGSVMAVLWLWFPSMFYRVAPFHQTSSKRRATKASVNAIKRKFKRIASSMETLVIIVDNLDRVTGAVGLDFILLLKKALEGEGFSEKVSVLLLGDYDLVLLAAKEAFNTSNPVSTGSSFAALIQERSDKYLGKYIDRTIKIAPSTLTVLNKVLSRESAECALRGVGPVKNIDSLLQSVYVPARSFEQIVFEYNLITRVGDCKQGDKWVIFPYQGGDYNYAELALLPAGSGAGDDLELKYMHPRLGKANELNEKEFGKKLFLFLCFRYCDPLAFGEIVKLASDHTRMFDMPGRAQDKDRVRLNMSGQIFGSSSNSDSSSSSNSDSSSILKNDYVKQLLSDVLDQDIDLNMELLIFMLRLLGEINLGGVVVVNP
ncbi:P-loop NTPase fold protein [Dermabacteraceae bacterium P13103]